MMMSPGERTGISCSMVSSTASPAFTIIITFRGLLSERASLSMEWQPRILLPSPRPDVKSSTLEMVRLYTATVKPLLSMLRTRFSPITARPMSPMSA